jgi:hypothetical protein
MPREVLLHTRVPKMRGFQKLVVRSVCLSVRVLLVLKKKPHGTEKANPRLIGLSSGRFKFDAALGPLNGACSRDEAEDCLQDYIICTQQIEGL